MTRSRIDRRTQTRSKKTCPAALLLQYKTRAAHFDSQIELQGEFEEGTTASPDPGALGED